MPWSFWKVKYYWGLSKLCCIRPHFQDMMQEVLDEHGNRLKAMGLPPNIAAKVALYVCIDGLVPMGLDSKVGVFGYLKQEQGNEFRVYKDALLDTYVKEEEETGRAWIDRNAGLYHVKADMK